jgi:glyoxalase family protein
VHVHGIHHVTAVTGHASENMVFLTQVLGMRLVKKTVNQDDISAYHLFYADEVGHPGTDLTFFDWPDAIKNRPGVGTVQATGLRVPPSTLDWWMERFDVAGVPHEEIVVRAGRQTLAFTDPEGQRLQLVEDEAPGGTPWAGGPVPPERGIRGLGPVTLAIGRAERTVRVLTSIMGYEERASYAAPEDGEPVRVFAVGGGGPGEQVHVAERPQMARGAVGIGGVHHVAFRTPTAEEHLQWQERLATSGLPATPVIDRYYFRSIYFREPGGVLFEIATDGPGFTGDEDAEHLGERLSLPPFLEPQRAAIEAGLRPLPTHPTGAGIEVLTREQPSDAG